MKQTGMFWHVHHDILLEYCHSYRERKDFIVNHKPSNEQELRLRLFRPVQGELPEKCLKAWAEWSKAWAEWDKAQAEWDKSRAERYKAQAEWDKAWAEWSKARAEWDKARAEWDKARAEWNRAWTECFKVQAEWKEEIEALHAKECPDCPWDGETIFV